MSGNIAGKVIVITGASSGLGEAAARHLSAAGAPVVLGARRTDRLDAIAKELTERGGEVLTLATDVTKRDQVSKLVDTAVEKFGRIDVMIYNAGPARLTALAKPCSLLGQDSGFIGSRVDQTEARINRKYGNSLRSL